MPDRIVGRVLLSIRANPSIDEYAKSWILLCGTARLPKVVLRQSYFKKEVLLKHFVNIVFSENLDKKE